MIEFTRSFKDSAGVCHASLAEAQRAELNLLLDGNAGKEVDMASFLLTEKARLIDILTTTVNSRPKARATNGGTKRRAPSKPTTVVVTADSTTPA